MTYPAPEGTSAIPEGRPAAPAEMSAAPAETPAAPDPAGDAGATRGAGPAGEAAGTGGSALVDSVRQRLAELDDAPVALHVAVYDEVHAGLQGALASLDES